MRDRRKAVAEAAQKQPFRNQVNFLCAVELEYYLLSASCFRNVIAGYTIFFFARQKWWIKHGWWSDLLSFDNTDPHPKETTWEQKAPYVCGQHSMHVQRRVLARLWNPCLTKTERDNSCFSSSVSSWQSWRNTISSTYSLQCFYLARAWGEGTPFIIFRFSLEHKRMWIITSVRRFGSWVTGETLVGKYHFNPTCTHREYKLPNRSLSSI